MAGFLLACAAFLLIHLVVSGTALRGAITGAVGERAYLAGFSLASAAILVWMIVAYGTARAGPNPVYWVLPTGALHAGSLVMLLAFLLAVPGLLSPGPTTVGMQARASEGPKGMHRITRHPFLWGVLIWAAFHMAANGDRVSLILFGTFFLLTVFGSRSIDRKRAKSMGEAWNAYAVSTSNMPFAAILAGRQKIALGEIGLVRVLAAFAVFAGVLYAHLRLFGVSPVPGWAPY